MKVNTHIRKVYDRRQPKSDYLKYWKVVKQWARAKYKLGTADIEIYNESAGKVQTANIGTYDYKTGTISLVGFEPTAIVGGSAYIKVSAVPLDPAVISPLRNYTLVLDESENEAFGNIEHTETKIVL